MSLKNAMMFMEKLVTNKEIAAHFQELPVTEALNKVNELGHECTSEELSAATKKTLNCIAAAMETHKDELSDEELAQVAGGMSNLASIFDSMSGSIGKAESDLRGSMKVKPHDTQSMLRFQQKMAQFSMLAQMQSNIMKTIGDSMKSTVANIR